MLAVASLALVGMSALPTRVFSQESCRRLVVGLVDDSGSCSAFLPSEVRKMREILIDLQQGDGFTVRTIRAESYGASNDIVPLVLFPARQRSIDADNARAVLGLKLSAVRALNGLLGQHPSPRTDIWQALYAAALTFRTTPATQRELAIASDMDDTGNHRPRTARLRLDGVLVRLFVPRSDNDSPDAFERRVALWRTVFLGAGARGVVVSELPRPLGVAGERGAGR